MSLPLPIRNKSLSIKSNLLYSEVKKMPYNVGDIVKVYEDPLSQKHLEGEAELVEMINEDDERECWVVQFKGDRERHVRWIKKKPEHKYPPSRIRPIVKADWDTLPKEAREEQLKLRGLSAEFATLVFDELPEPIEVELVYPERIEKARLGLEKQHHSDGSKAERRPLCQKLQYFIDEEEKGIGEYEDFIAFMVQQLEPPARSGVLQMLNRIIEEQRNHVQILKRIQETLCPS
jgi:hypothetical protein